jgi:hypothetical protein
MPEQDSGRYWSLDECRWVPYRAPSPPQPEVTGQRTPADDATEPVAPRS